MFVVLTLAALVFGTTAAVSPTWEKCPFEISPTSGFKADCWNASAPLDWDAPGGPKIDLFVTRLSPSTTKSRRQVWLLMGGPGAWDCGFAQDMAKKDLAGIFGPDAELLFMDHRGTGYSSPLDCSDFLDMKKCLSELLAQWGKDGLQQFTSTNAARDLQFLIEATNEGQDLGVYGISYGTWLTQRLLAYREAVGLVWPPIRMVVLDGVCAPDRTALSTYDVNVDSVGRILLGQCDSDEDWCTKQFGGFGAWRTLFDIMHEIDEGRSKCVAKLDPVAQKAASRLRNVIGTATTDQYGRMLVPPLIRRLSRCNAADVVALNYLFKRYSSHFQSNVKPVPGSIPLMRNIGLSELYSLTIPPPSKEQLDAMIKTLLFTVNGDAEDRLIWDYWPRYPLDSLFGKFPSMGNVSLLILNGDLDHATPLCWATRVSSHYEGDGTTDMTFAKIPNAPHGTVLNSAVIGSDDACGLMMFGSFVRSSGHQVDKSCLSKLVPLDWRCKTEEVMKLSEKFFGTRDAWGN